MPNWTFNKLFVSGPKEEIRAFRKLVQVKDESGKLLFPLTFTSIVPVPSAAKLERHYRTMKATFKREHGYPLTSDVRVSLWRCENWGTKWDAYGGVLRRKSRTSLLYTFDTAWSPPDEWVEEASRRFPRLRFRLHSWEDAMWTKEILHFQSGKMVFSKDSELQASQ